MTKSGTVLFLAVFAIGSLCAAAPAAERRQAAYDWKVRVAYPETGNGNIDADLNQWLENHVNTLIRDMAGVTLMPDLPEMTGEIDIDYRIARPSHRVLGVVFTTYRSPARAAHPMTLVDTLTYDLRDGSVLTLEDMFGKPDVAVAVMSREAPRILAEYVAATTGDAACDDSVLFRDGFAPDRENFRTLVLEPGGVRVIFQQYQALPYVFGLPEAFYPLSSLALAEPDYALWGGEKAAR